jgi:hypothetical protein
MASTFATHPSPSLSDIALRDLGLLVGALALARLAAFVHHKTLEQTGQSDA